MAFCRQKLGTRSGAEHSSRLSFWEGVALCGGFSLLLPAPRLWTEGREFTAVTPEGREAAQSLWGCWTHLVCHWTDTDTAELGVGAPGTPDISGPWAGPWAPSSCWHRQRELCTPWHTAVLFTRHALSLLSKQWLGLALSYLSVWTPMASTISESIIKD